MRRDLAGVPAAMEEEGRAAAVVLSLVGFPLSTSHGGWTQLRPGHIRGLESLPTTPFPTRKSGEACTHDLGRGL